MTGRFARTAATLGLAAIITSCTASSAMRTERENAREQERRIEQLSLLIERPAAYAECTTTVTGVLARMTHADYNGEKYLVRVLVVPQDGRGVLSCIPYDVTSLTHRQAEAYDCIVAEGIKGTLPVLTLQGTNHVEYNNGTYESAFEVEWMRVGEKTIRFLELD